MRICLLKKEIRSRRVGRGIIGFLDWFVSFALVYYVQADSDIQVQDKMRRYFASIAWSFQYSIFNTDSRIPIDNHDYLHSGYPYYDSLTQMYSVRQNLNHVNLDFFPSSPSLTTTGSLKISCKLHMW